MPSQKRPPRSQQAPRERHSLYSKKQERLADTTEHQPPHASKDRNSSHLRGLPPHDLLREVRRRHKTTIQIAADEEMATIARLMTTLRQFAEAQALQPRRVGRRLNCKALMKALEFLYRRGLPLRSHAASEAVHLYSRELATTEPRLRNPRATARSRLRRLTDLRRWQGFPDPEPGRPPEAPAGHK